MEKPAARRDKFSIFGPRALDRVVRCVAEGQGLSKTDFMEKNCILYSNRSAAHLKLGQYQAALEDADKAQQLNPKWPKVRPDSITP
ncbi:tetratricopeptide repeat protein 28-like [Arapaima gigas]